ncbi:MAG: rhomboid family intramembrane serine protease [Butyrivibrio sp.]|nr:rhomboid family intramembrane serine protease [Acetatifactor muris]MCM1559442.1 rhomboid family intramembrane serine protease [Butyrivibrio sp.]
MDDMSKWERKFGKYAIPNLTYILIGCYVAGYLLEWLAPSVLGYLILDPYAILHGQIWRLVTWIISPPSSFDFFTLIMLMFYLSLGTTLERVWGTWQYNVYIFTGILLTVLAGFVCMGVFYLIYGESASIVCALGAGQFSTYFINMSIFLAYAATFPNAEVLLMFVIPIKVKFLGVIYGVMLVYQMVEYFRVGKSGYVWYWFGVAAIAASLLNFVIFWLRSRNHMHLNPKQVKRKMEFKRDIRRNPNPKITKHKCAICGRSEEDDPTLEFRFCSKCNGNYEYCQNHLYTHQHRT